MNMKKLIRLLLIVGFTFIVSVVFSQPHPSNSGVGGGTGGSGPINGSAPGGGAPVGGGIEMLLIMAAAYGYKRIYEFRKK